MIYLAHVAGYGGGGRVRLFRHSYENLKGAFMGVSYYLYFI